MNDCIYKRLWMALMEYALKRGDDRLMRIMAVIELDEYKDK